jgi:hypothetical protein
MFDDFSSSCRLLITAFSPKNKEGINMISDPFLTLDHTIYAPLQVIESLQDLMFRQIRW